MKLVNAELNRARNAEKKVINEIKDDFQKEELQAVLKDSKYAVLKPEEHLTEKQKIKLEAVKQTFPKLAEMHRQKEAFRSIFEEAKDCTDGVFQMLDWLKDAQHTFRESAATIGWWFEEISNYFESRITSGAIEGINNQLKLIERSGLGGAENFSKTQMRLQIVQMN